MSSYSVSGANPSCRTFSERFAKLRTTGENRLRSELFHRIAVRKSMTSTTNTLSVSSERTSRLPACYSELFITQVESNATKVDF